MTSVYELAEHGSDLALTVRGDGLLACLDAALRGFAAHVAEVAPDAPRQARPVALRGAPAVLLVGLVDEAIAALDIDGTLACGIRDGTVDDEGLRASLETVALDGLALRGAPPKAATWHSARFERADGGWEGRVVLDL